MEESTQEDNQTNERYSMNFYSPIKYEKEISKTQPKERGNLKKNIFALGDRNILISSSPKVSDESEDDQFVERTDKHTEEDVIESYLHRRERSVSDLDRSLSIDIQQHAFPAQNIQMAKINSGAITNPHKNLNHIFISLEDRDKTNRHIKNVKSDVLNQNIKRTFDDLLKRKEDKENQAKCNIEVIKKQLLQTFFNLEGESKPIPVPRIEGLATIYESNLNENSQFEGVTPRDNQADSIKNKYKRERIRNSSIFSSEDLRISNTEAISLKQSEFVFNSPVFDKLQRGSIVKEFEEDKREQVMKANRKGELTTNPISIRGNAAIKQLTVQKAEVLNIIMNPAEPGKQLLLQGNIQKNYLMAIGAKLSFETPKEEAKQQLTSQPKEKLHSKASTGLPSYQMKSVRQLNLKKITIKPNSPKARAILPHYSDYSSNKLTTLPSEKLTKLNLFMKTTNQKRNSSNPTKPQLIEVMTNRQEMIQLISSEALRFNKKADKFNILQLLMKRKEGCYVIAANAIHSEGKPEKYLFKGLYQYNATGRYLGKVHGDADCVMILQENEIREKLRTAPLSKQVALPCRSNVIMINNI